METQEIDAASYWKYQFTSIFDRTYLTEYQVIDIDKVDFDVNESRAAIRNKFKLVQVEVKRVKDIGVNDTTFIVYTHLGEILNYNDIVLGYDLAALNVNE